MPSVHCSECLYKVGEPRDSPFLGVDLDTLQIYYCYHCENYIDSLLLTNRE